MEFTNVMVETTLALDTIVLHKICNMKFGKNTYGLLGRRSECGGAGGKSGDNGELHFDFIYIKTGT